ncbi:type II secretion system protein, partial [bacterium]|nr:type II secretion system protein [bacterium]
MNKNFEFSVLNAQHSHHPKGEGERVLVPEGRMRGFTDPSLRANEVSVAISGALDTRHSELVSESVKAVSQKQTLMSTDDRLTRFGQPQRFALSQVQGDGWSSNSALDAKHSPHPSPLPKGEGERVLSFSPREKVPEGRMRGFTDPSLRAKRSSAFTIAEVLLTIGILGVIAVMTVPTLMQNSQNKELVSKYLKTNNV